MFIMSKEVDLNQLVQGGQLYRAFPFSNASLVNASLRKCTKLYPIGILKRIREYFELWNSEHLNVP